MRQPAHGAVRDARSSPFAVRAAAAGDAAAVVRLLRDCDLPTADVAQHLPHFFVARSNGALVGVVGVQPAGQEGLLRSLAVAADFRGQGIARALCARAAEHAPRQGIRTLYLLTTTASAFFAGLGFEGVQRATVPQSIRSTLEFSTLCPGSAVVMAKRVA